LHVDREFLAERMMRNAKLQTTRRRNIRNPEDDHCPGDFKVKIG